MNDLLFGGIDADSSNNIDSQAHYHRGTGTVNRNGAGSGDRSSRLRSIFPNGDLAWVAVGLEQRLKLAADPGGHRAFAIDGPGQHGATVDVLDEPGELRRIARAKLTGGDGFLEEFPAFRRE